METGSRRARYPWLMQIVFVAVGLAWMLWFGWGANEPDDEILFAMASRKSGWVTFVESRLRWSGSLSLAARDAAVGGAVLLALVPVFVWGRRLHRGPPGFVCARCHKDMTDEPAVAFHAGVLVCTACAAAVEDMGAKDLVRLEPRHGCLPGMRSHPSIP